MEKINSEEIISSLIVMGFDKVDSILFTHILGKIAIEERTKFRFVDKEFSNMFNYYFNYDGLTYSLKEGFTLDMNINPIPNDTYIWTLASALKTNKALIKYIKKLDFKEIVMKKINIIGYENIDNYINLFSNKEKEIISEIFEIDNANSENIEKKLEK